MGKTIVADSVVQQTIYQETPQQSTLVQISIGVAITLIAGFIVFLCSKFYKKVLSNYSFKIERKE